MGILQPRHGAPTRHGMYERPLPVRRYPGQVAAFEARATGYPLPVWRGASSGYFTTSINPYSAASSGLIQ